MEKRDDSSNWQQLADSAHKSGHYEEAVQFYQKALALQPRRKGLHADLGTVWRRLGKMAEALVCYRQELAHDPDNAFVYFNMGNLYQEIEKFGEAALCYQQAIKLKPDFASVYNNYGRMLWLRCRKVREAIAVLRQGLSIDKNAGELHYNYSLALLLAGKWAEGFAEYNWRKKENDWDGRQILAECPLPFWSGEYFSGKRLLLIDEQGFGDTIQFCRYLPLVKERGGIVTFLSKKATARLLTRAGGVDQILVMGENKIDFNSFDLAVFLLDLPRIFGTTTSTVPAQSAYLRPEPVWQQKWQEKVARTGPPGYKRIGLVWAGNIYGGALAIRTAKLKHFAPLAAVPQTTYYSLQKGEAAKEIYAADNCLKLFDFTAELHDFADTLALLSQFDLVISIDTSVAHLAAAAGVPTWILLPYASEWRWLQDKEKTPWYQSMRLFRQTKPGDWEGVLGQVSSELALSGKYHKKD